MPVSKERLISLFKKFNREEITYYMYISCILVLCIPSFYYFLFNPKEFPLYLNNTMPFIFPIWFIAFLIDICKLIKKIWGTFLGKLLYSVMAYFAYASSVIISKEIIYLNTGSNPDFFQSSINILAGILLIPTWLIGINILLGFLVLVISILSFLPILFFSLVKSKKLYNYILEKTNIDVTLLSTKIKAFSFFIGITVFGFYSDIFIKELKPYKESQIIKFIILTSSYFPHKNTCKNISNGDPIKFLDDNRISVAVIGDEQMSNMFKFEFDIKECK